ncbi:MAG: hypothetical protein C7B43_18080 [Sulfobacillus benefaciens]|uniref:Glycerophosphoryl diester phosphodiesterase membrane domain-containing protein n=1 Tax=Sulfobacillus benefaciens TaxID=453960 RepID=A0A2T2WRH5_9FIRM|nr:MAG: hypothetical protein C7B43_18080 [Sulfobacillus benefaciens]
MLRNAVKMWLNGLKQGGTWTTLIWMAIFSLTFFLLLLAIGGASLAGTMLHPGFTQPLGTSSTSASAATHLVVGVVFVYLLMLGATPFLTGGIYGLYGQAVQGIKVSWGTFWTMGKKLYGRGWGLIGYVILYVMVIGIFASIVIATLHVTGIILALAAFILTLPWGLRMTGELFVDQNTWGKSFRQSFQKRYYGQLLLGLALGAIAYLLLIFLDVMLVHALGAVGIALYLILELVFAVAVPLWLFALYAATKTGSSSQQ